MPCQKDVSLSLSPRGTIDVMAAERMPGIAATRSINWPYASRIAVGLDTTVGDSATCAVRRLWVLNPGSTFPCGSGLSSQAFSTPVMRLMASTKVCQPCFWEARTLRPWEVSW